MNEQMNIKGLADAFSGAAQHHRSGNKDAAKAGYEGILAQQKAFQPFIQAQTDVGGQQKVLVQTIFSQTYNNLGIFLEEEKLFGQALTYFRKALDLSPGNVEALTNMARVYTQQRNFDSAYEAAKKALNLKPDFVPAIFQFCRACYNFGHVAEAITALEQVPEDLKTNAGLNTEYGRILEKAGRFEEAVQKFDLAIVLAPKNIYARISLANVLFKMNRFEKALNTYHEILQIDPKYVPALTGMGFLLQNMGQFQDAMKCYQDALAINPGHHETLGFYASILDLTGQTKEALEMASNLLQMPKIPERALLTGGLTKAGAERKLGQFDDAVETLKAIRPHAKTPLARIQVHFGLGYAYEQMQKPGEAFTEFEKANAAFLEANSALIPASGELEGLLDDLLAADFSVLKQDEKGEDAPVFIIGPVLGGGHALAQLLAYTPGVRVYEDTHVLQGIRRRIAKADGGYPDALFHFEEGDAEHLKELYDEVNAKSVFKGEEGGQVIEADAMHIIDLPLILKLFPGAKFVFIEGDARDSVFNTFAKDFIPTRTSVNYANLEKVATLYAKTMDVWAKYQKELSLEVLTLDYGTFIKDPAKGLLKVLKFIGHTDAKGAKKAYGEDAFFNKAAELENRLPPGRWEKYKAQMDAVADILKPYIKKN